MICSHENVLKVILKKFSLMALFEHDQCPLFPGEEEPHIHQFVTFSLSPPSTSTSDCLFLNSLIFPFIHLEPNSITDNRKTFKHSYLHIFAQCCSSQRIDFCHFLKWIPFNTAGMLTSLTIALSWCLRCYVCIIFFILSMTHRDIFKDVEPQKMIATILVKLTTCKVKDYASYGQFITSK